MTHALENAWRGRMPPFSGQTIFTTEDIGWDYVKSLSTDGGSLVRDFSAIPTVIAKMQKYRGQIEGGLCARRIEDYDPTSEQRYFVWRGVAHSDTGAVPAVVAEAATRVASPFFSIDIARRRDGAWRVIELGDGQVSDRKHWSCSRFIRMLTSGS